MNGHNVLIFVMTAATTLLTSACVTAESKASSAAAYNLMEFAPKVALPERPAGAKGGREILGKLAGLSLNARENALIAEITSGNVPSSMRKLVPIKIPTQDKSGRQVSGIAWVLADYLAVGSDTDYVHIPLSFPAAQRLAARLGLMLPTVPIVDAIYEQADVRLTPQPLPASASMTTIAGILRHEAMLTSQLANVGKPQDLGRPALIAGHKKDVVLNKRLAVMRDRVAIFGWHRAKDRPIQQLSTVHDKYYVDYSHGIRFISPTITFEKPQPNLVARAFLPKFDQN